MMQEGISNKIDIRIHPVVIVGMTAIVVIEIGDEGKMNVGGTQNVLVVTKILIDLDLRVVQTEIVHESGTVDLIVTGDAQDQEVENEDVDNTAYSNLYISQQFFEHLPNIVIILYLILGLDRWQRIREILWILEMAIRKN